MANNEITETDPEPIWTAEFGSQPIHKLFDFTDIFSKSAMYMWSFDKELSYWIWMLQGKMSLLMI